MRGVLALVVLLAVSSCIGRLKVDCDPGSDGCALLAKPVVVQFQPSNTPTTIDTGAAGIVMHLPPNAVTQPMAVKAGLIKVSGSVSATGQDAGDGDTGGTAGLAAEGLRLEPSGKTLPQPISVQYPVAFPEAYADLPAGQQKVVPVVPYWRNSASEPWQRDTGAAAAAANAGGNALGVLVLDTTSTPPQAHVVLVLDHFSEHTFLYPNVEATGYAGVGHLFVSATTADGVQILKPGPYFSNGLLGALSLDLALDRQLVYTRLIKELALQTTRERGGLIHHFDSVIAAMSAKVCPGCDAQTRIDLGVAALDQLSTNLGGVRTLYENIQEWTDRINDLTKELKNLKADLPDLPSTPEALDCVLDAGMQVVLAALADQAMIAARWKVMRPLLEASPLATRDSAYGPAIQAADAEISLWLSIPVATNFATGIKKGASILWSQDSCRDLLFSGLKDMATDAFWTALNASLVADGVDSAWASGAAGLVLVAAYLVGDYVGKDLVEARHNTENLALLATMIDAGGLITPSSSLPPARAATGGNYFVDIPDTISAFSGDGAPWHRMQVLSYAAETIDDTVSQVVLLDDVSVTSKLLTLWGDLFSSMVSRKDLAAVYSDKAQRFTDIFTQIDLSMATCGVQPVGATCADADGDGYGTGASCVGPDCDDGNSTVHDKCAAPPPACQPITCPAGACGMVANGCGSTLNCGACACPTGAAIIDCGLCGKQTRVCDTTTGTWGAFGACTGQGACTPNAMQACTGGTQVCQSTCTWGVCNTQAIAVSSPAAGDVWLVGHAYNSIWSSVGVSAPLRLVATKSGVEVTPTISTTEPTSGSQSITVPSTWVAGSDYKICATANGGTVFGCSGAFAIGVCAPGATRCAGGVSYVCNKDAAGETPTTCPTGTCTGTTCAATVCTPGATRCSAGVAYACNAQGTAESPSSVCQYGCAGAQCAACSAGQSRCAGGIQYTCDAKGLGETSLTCSYGCASTGGRCASAPPVCTPNVSRCVAGVLYTCSADGTAETQVACSSGYCNPPSGAALACGSCNPEGIRCVAGVQYTCNYQGTAETAVACASGACATNNQQCKICDANTKRCAGGVQYTCTSSGGNESGAACPITGACAPNNVDCLGAVCTPGQVTCTGGALSICNDNGTAVSMTSCPTGTCVGAACATPICKPGGARCTGGVVYTCNAQGTAETAAPPCPLGCAVDSCATCAPGQSRCTGGVQYTCNAQGTAETSLVCSSGACATNNQQCKICEPSSVRCSSGVQYTCSSSGGAESGVACPTTGACAANNVDCQTQVCPPGQNRCASGVLYTCNSQGSGETSMACPSATCASDFVSCQAAVCTPGQTTCSGGVLSTCNSNGTGATTAPCASGACAGAACAPACLAGWAYMMDIKLINNAPTDQTDYQVALTVPFVAGKMNADFSDLRFTDSSCQSYSFWIESFVASTSATVWVKVPWLPSSSSPLDMYYGNPSATAASDPTGTMLFYDDGSSTAGWTVTDTGSGAFASVGGYLQLLQQGGTCCSWYGTSVEKPISPPLTSGQYVVRFKNRTSKGGYTVCGGNTFNLTGTAGLGVRLEDDLYCNSANDNTLSFGDTTIKPSTWFAPHTFNAFSIFEVKPLDVSALTATLFKDGNQVAQVTGVDAASLSAVQLSTSVNNNTYTEIVQFDDIVIRKYVVPEPYPSFGTEQTR